MGAKDFVTQEELLAFKNELKESVDSLYGALTQNTRTTKENNEKSEELLQLYGDVKGWLRVGKALGDLMTWLAKIAIGLGICWVIFKYGILEAIESIKGTNK